MSWPCEGPRVGSRRLLTQRGRPRPMWRPRSLQRGSTCAARRGTRRGTLAEITRPREVLQAVGDREGGGAIRRGAAELQRQVEERSLAALQRRGELDDVRALSGDGGFSASSTRGRAAGRGCTRSACAADGSMKASNAASRQHRAGGGGPRDRVVVRAADRAAAGEGQRPGGAGDEECLRRKRASLMPQRPERHPPTATLVRAGAAPRDGQRGALPGRQRDRATMPPGGRPAGSGGARAGVPRRRGYPDAAARSVDRAAPFIADLAVEVGPPAPRDPGPRRPDEGVCCGGAVSASSPPPTRSTTPASAIGARKRTAMRATRGSWKSTQSSRQGLRVAHGPRRRTAVGACSAGSRCERAEARKGGQPRRRRATSSCRRPRRTRRAARVEQRSAEAVTIGGVELAAEGRRAARRGPAPPADGSRSGGCRRCASRTSCRWRRRRTRPMPPDTARRRADDLPWARAKGNEAQEACRSPERRRSVAVPRRAFERRAAREADQNAGGIARQERVEKAVVRPRPNGRFP